MRDSTIIYRSFYESIKELPKENQAEIWGAIFEYSLNFTEVELTGINKTVFTLIKPQLDANIKRYKNGLEPKTKPQISKPKAKGKQVKSKGEANANENLNPNENENKNLNYTFELFWEQYPVKKEKQECLKKWDKLSNDEKTMIQKTLPGFISNKPFEDYNHPYPSTYLNQKRWEDEVDTKVSPGQPAPTGEGEGW